MADQKISELTDATTLTGTEQIPLVQSSTTKKATINDITNHIITVAKTASADEVVDLDSSTYENAMMIKLTWDGSSGTATYTLPDATSSNSTNRVLRFITDSTFSASTRVDITPASGQNLDGATSSYEINKAYEGIAVWSDGIEWFIVQKKA
jgi:hypothetical protein